MRKDHKKSGESKQKLLGPAGLGGDTEEEGYLKGSEIVSEK